MADIRQYRKDKENIENDEYEKKLRIHKIKTIRLVIILAAIFILTVLTISLIRHKTNYSSVKKTDSIRRNDSGVVEYQYFGNKIVRCSRDGIAAYNFKGDTVWNSTYEINNLAVDMSGSYLAVADLNGNSIYTYNANGHVANINTALPILQISVSKAGYVVAVLEDKDADYITMYSFEGEKIYTIKKTIGIDGVPVSICASPDGEKLIAAFTGVSGNAIKTSVVFYNFDEVGQNENERVVGGYDFGENIVGKVKFVGNTSAVAFAENKICVYTISEYPSLVKEIPIDYTINSVITGGNRFAVIHKDNEQLKTIVTVYSNTGDKIYSVIPEVQYTNYKFAGDSLLMYNESECILLNSKGKKKFSNTFEDGIVNMIPVSGDEEYILINRSYINKIKLK